MSNLTKTAIKQTFLELLDQMPISQISVKMIVEACGINRNSFYYHYKDLPDLIDEIIKEEADRIMREYPAIETVETALMAAVDFASQNRRAILHVYHSVNRDIFERYLWGVCEYVIQAYGTSVLKGRELPEQDREVISHFYQCECFGLVIDWLNCRMEPDIQKDISRFCELHHGMIEEMIERSLKSKMPLKES
ncbi:MAG: TetR/AcrR family transcriptional regulator C-terminal domain-containing protein [Lachnospiraceae bacterium]|nr:TetR/AcrR family transcriptional regulator C-terminal domain-containing protein [Lachnospiraceae bacterium]